MLSSPRRQNTNCRKMSTLTTAAHVHQSDVSPSAWMTAKVATATTLATPNQTIARNPESNGAPHVATM